MKNLKEFNVIELHSNELKNVNGGYWQLVIAGAVAIGAAMEWAFEKGEELGKALA